MTAFFEQSRKPDRSAGVSFPAVRAIGLEGTAMKFCRR